MSAECNVENIPLGNKQTEVGVIPEDWEVSKLSELGEVIRGASPRPKGDKRFYGGSIPRLMVEDVTRDGKIVTPQIDFLTEEGAKRSRPCKKGTLTIVCSGTVGIPSFLGVDACIHDGFLALVNIRKNSSDEYLYHQLCCLRESFENSATHGGIFTNLTTFGVKEFKVPLPPTKAEQEAIAEALSDTDALIESLKQLIAKKHQIKQGAMQELLTGKRRLPGFEIKQGYKQTEVGVIPEDWEVLPLDAFLSFISYGFTNPMPTSESGGIYMITAKDINGGKIQYDTARCTTEEAYRTLLTDKSRAKAGDLLLTKDGTLGRVALVDNKKICINQSVAVLRLNSKADAKFLKILLEDPQYQSRMLEDAGGSTIKHIYITIVNRMPIAVPPTKAEQEAIAIILSDMDSEITILEEKLAKTRQIKQGMMQELLTGKIRLI